MESEQNNDDKDCYSINFLWVGFGKINMKRYDK